MGDIVTAGMVVIGDEILSGRTKDKNIGYIAEYLTNVGIDVHEVRVVPDVEDEIVAALNALRDRYDHVFTTGGIGPTHDDITADSVARAFGVPIDVDPRARALLLERIPEDQLNAARLRMARIPEGAELIENSVSKAPGFTIGNVHVMAGVPEIFRVMVDGLVPRLGGGRPLISRSVRVNMPEGLLAAPLGEVAADHPKVVIGCYPFHQDGKPSANVVFRSEDEAALEAAAAALCARVGDKAAAPV